MFTKPLSYRVLTNKHFILADLLDLDIGTTVSEGDSTDAPPSEAIVPAENEATILMDPLLQESIQAETAEQQGVYLSGRISPAIDPHHNLSFISEFVV